MPEPANQAPDKRSYSNQGRIPTEREMELQNRVYDLVDAIDDALDVLEKTSDDPTDATRLVRGVHILTAVLEGTPAYQNRAEELEAAIRDALADLDSAKGRITNPSVYINAADWKLKRALGIPQ